MKRPPDPPKANAGFGAQTHGSRKGLGGDPPNGSIKRPGTPRPDAKTQAQIDNMESEGGSSD